MNAKLFFFLLIVIRIALIAVPWAFQSRIELHLEPISFSELPGWQKGELSTSLQTFQRSCRTFLKQKPDKFVGSQLITLQAKDWQTLCQAAIQVDAQSESKARLFFESWFIPVEFYEKAPVEGLFTGYYMPLLQGSLTKTNEFNTPIYGLPRDLIRVHLASFNSELKHYKPIVGRVNKNQLVPYYSRKEINQGAIDKVASVIAWVTDKVERQFLEIEGSGVVALPNGKKIALGYAGQNGRPYTSIAKVLIDKGVMTRDNASMQRIRDYFKNHPKEVAGVLNHNESFVFFQTLAKEEAYGSQGVALTPGYSLAVDLKWVPIGTPIWLNTTRPDVINKTTQFKRLMIAQDTGGAIRGPVRGDVYWGSGDEAIYIAGHMKHKGRYWLLLPKLVVPELQSKGILSGTR